VSGRAGSLGDGVVKARDSIDSGAALSTLERYLERSQ
jgi:anthranilate phosphoribosyltransferase